MSSAKIISAVFFSFVFLAASILFAQPKLTSEGIRLPLKGLDDLVFEYPQLQDNGTKTLAKVFDKVITDNGRNAVIKYEGNTELHYAVKNNGLVELRINNPPANFSKLRFGTLIPFAINEGGKFSIDGGDAKPFPMEKPAQPHLYQGSANSILITAPSGATLKISGFEVGNYFQVQDNREWNWSIYYLMILCPYNKDHEVIELRFESGKDETVKVEKIVDKFGQDFSRSFTGKISSEDELKKDVETDKEYYASFPKQTGLDEYGGFDGTGKALGLKKTGFFHVQQVNGKWYLVNPVGNVFFHRALCVFNPSDDYTYTQGRESIFEWLPPRSGRFFEMNTGEKANTGLFSVADRPWKDFIAEVVKTNTDILPVLEGKRKPFVFDDPRFVPKK
ncbi:MAG: hypothetical protein FWE67_11840 [Planctomycetaceae bacterium]|nr:hypothetical protein [Planctomycetaceae bacterium]